MALPHSKYSVAAYYLIAPSEAASNLARYDGVHYGHRAAQFDGLIDMYAASRGEGFGAEVKRRIMLGNYALSAGYYDAYYLKRFEVRRLIRGDFDRAFESCDLILGPVTPTPAFKVGELIDDPLAMYLSDIYTISANLAGLPAISLPGGASEAGLPIGLQLLGPPFAEERLLRAARMFEARNGLAQQAAHVVSSEMNYTTVIGLEVHVQLLTRTKLFCGCLNRFNPTQPNVQTCPVCLGLPGSLPVMNRAAFELALKTGMALNCTIPPVTKWDRKQYYYPDLPKGYQISQYDLPFSSEGWLEIATEKEPIVKKRIGIIRASRRGRGQEFPRRIGAGRRQSHRPQPRGNAPVGNRLPARPAPGAEAHAYLDELKLLLTYLEVSDCNMQEGSLRCDANVNLHVQGGDGKSIATPIVEIKNLNSFRGVEAAIEYEASRQFEEFQRTGKKFGEVPKETRGWDAERGVTFAQRGKEEAADYRYFPDPDLVPVTVSEEQKRKIREAFCEFPAAKRARFESEHQLSNYDASVIVAQGETFADYFERVAHGCGDAKQAANWMTQDVLREMKERKTSIEEFPIGSDVLTAILSKIGQRKITNNSGRTVFLEILAREMADGGIDLVDAIIAEKSLAITADAGELAPVIEAVLAKNAKIVADVKGGKQQAVGALIGQVMKQAKGADPQAVREMLIAKIATLP